MVIGAAFANHTGIAPFKPILQIDDDHAAIGRFDSADAHVLGDAALILDDLMPRATYTSPSPTPLSASAAPR